MNIFYIIRVKIEIKGTTVMRWIGYFLLFLLCLFILLIFVKIKIRVVFQDESRFVQVKYLFFKYKMDLNPMMKELEKNAELSADKMKDEVTVKKEEVVVKTKTVEQKVIEDSMELDEKPKIKVKRVKKKKRVEKTQEKVSRPKLRQMIRKFKLLFKTGKRVLVRFTKKIRVHQLDSVIHFSVDDPMLNGCLLGSLWAMQANVYGFISRYVKKVDHYHLDVLSQFSGNRIFVDFTCIVSFKLVDIIVVLLTSFRDLMTILKLIRKEEDL